MTNPAISLRAHMIPPHDTNSLEKCAKEAYNNLTKPNRWRQDVLGLNYRTLCLPQTLVKKSFVEVAKVVNVATMYPKDPTAHPDLSRTMDFATRAGVAALMLYRLAVEKLDNNHIGQQDWSTAYYLSFVQLHAEMLDVDASLDDLRFLAATCTLQSGAGAPKRDWTVLMEDDTKWCLVAPRQEWSGLIEAYPQTRPYFDNFSILKELVPPADALRRVWYSPAPQEVLVLPDLNTPSP